MEYPSTIEHNVHLLFLGCIEQGDDSFLQVGTDQVEPPIEVEHLAQPFGEMLLLRWVLVHERIHPVRSEGSVPHCLYAGRIGELADATAELAGRRETRFGYSTMLIAPLPNC